MKILFYINTIGGGGAERVMTNLASFFAEQNDVLLVTSYPCEDEYTFNEKIKRISIEEHPINGFIRRNYKYVTLLREIIKKEKPDTVVSFMAEPNIRLLIATLFIKVRKIISVRNDPDKEYDNIVSRLLAKTLFNLADNVVIQTEDERAWFPKTIQKKCVVIMNQVKQDFFITPHVSNDYFVATGRLVNQKNYPLMISAFAEVVKKLKDEKLLIYGEGDQKDSLTKLIKELQVENNVFLMGRTANMPEVLSHAKCFLLSSDFEGMPNGLLEAMAMGVPCISTDCPCGGPRFLIENNKNGMLVHLNDRQAMIDAIQFFLSDKSFQKKIGERAKEMSMEFKPEIVLNEWETVIKGK